MTEVTSFFRKRSIKHNHKLSPVVNFCDSKLQNPKKFHPSEFINYSKLAYFPRILPPNCQHTLFTNTMKYSKKFKILKIKYDILKYFDYINIALVLYSCQVYSACSQEKPKNLKFSKSVSKRKNQPFLTSFQITTPPLKPNHNSHALCQF